MNKIEIILGLQGLHNISRSSETKEISQKIALNFGTCIKPLLNSLHNSLQF
jgi:hypothetical protein